MTVHLLDEAKHTEAFCRLLEYLYPSYKNHMALLLKSNEVFTFYDLTHKSESTLHWLICTYIAEIFGIHCSKAIRKALIKEPVVKKFFERIISDDIRHRTYLIALMEFYKIKVSKKDWAGKFEPFIEKMIVQGQYMVQGKQKKSHYQSFVSLGIDITEICEDAIIEIKKTFRGFK